MIPQSQRGATLIELVIAIVVITAAAGTIVGLLATMSRNSASVMTQAQSASIANAYLNEIIALPVANPDGPNPRAGTNSVDDYPGCLTDDLVRDRKGNLVANLSSYRVNVFVSQQVFNGLAASDVRQVEVVVTDPLGELTRLRGYRTDHP